MSEKLNLFSKMFGNKKGTETTPDQAVFQIGDQCHVTGGEHAGKIVTITYVQGPEHPTVSVDLGDYKYAEIPRTNLSLIK